MHKTHLYYSLIIALLLTMTSALTAAPRLTVVVVVDGLNQADLVAMHPYWPKGGMRTLSEEAYQTSVDYSHQIYGGVETLATLLTGTTPSEHGVVMDRYFSRKDRAIHALLQDNTESGIGTPIAYSPRALPVPTISDELRMQAGEEALIYAIGIDPEPTILLAGHAANACCWIGAPTPYDSLRWVSTSFYGEGLPTEADRMNTDGRFSHIAGKTWTPRMDIGLYNHPTAEEKKHSFNYTGSSCLSHTPMANTLVVELALALQRDKHLGENMVPDMLMLQMTVLSPKAQSDRISSAEQEDMYLSLNQDLGYLMEQLDHRIGEEQYSLLVLGRPCLGTQTESLSRANMPLHYLNVDRLAALTSTYLMALYGHERWIDGGYGHSIYLNRTLIEQKRLSLSTIQRQVADFLMEFEGIRIACPASEAYLRPDLTGSLHKRFVGDIVFELQNNYCLSYTYYNPDTREEEERPIDFIVDRHPTSPLLYRSGSAKPFPTSMSSATEVWRLVIED